RHVPCQSVSSQGNCGLPGTPSGHLEALEEAAVIRPPVVFAHHVIVPAVQLPWSEIGNDGNLPLLLDRYLEGAWIQMIDPITNTHRYRGLVLRTACYPTEQHQSESSGASEF